MILAKPGILSTAQDLTSNTTTDSENVIQMAAVDWASYTDLWWLVETETVATGDSSDTYKFALVVSAEATLDTNIEILSRTVTSYVENTVAVAGGRIVSCNIGKMLNEVLMDDMSTYYFVGMISTISAGATISINAALSPTEPPTFIHKQTVVSNVGTPDVAS